MTLVEIMIAMVLASLVSTSILLVLRAQLRAFERNDATTRALQNARGGIDYMERLLKMACAGAAKGEVGIHIPGVTGAGTVVPCIRFWDGAAILPNGTFGPTGATDSTPDAVEFFYATGPMTMGQANVMFANSALPNAQVASTKGFAIGDLVLITPAPQAPTPTNGCDYAGNGAILMRIGNIVQGAPGTFSTFNFDPPPGPITDANAPRLLSSAAGVGGCVTPTTVTGGNVAAFNPETQPRPPGSTSAFFMKAQSVSFYVSTVASNLDNVGMLMLDRDGMLGTDHTDAVPIAENVVDLQFAVAQDMNVPRNGWDDEPTDRWVGNAVNELPLAAPPWNAGGGPWSTFPIAVTSPRYMFIRATLVAQTGNTYPGTQNNLGAIENRTQPLPDPTPTVTSDAVLYRPLRVIVTPNAWATE
jgi:hypothetical protein